MIPFLLACLKYYQTHSYMQETEEIITQLKREARVDQFNNNNMPEYAKDFLFIDEFDRIGGYRAESINVPEIKEEMLYDLNPQNQYYEEIAEILPKDLDNIKEKFVPIILQKMNEEKRTDYLSPEEQKNAPKRPSNRHISQTVKYWCAIGLSLLKNGDSNTSLLLPLASFYLMRELEFFYGNCSDIFFKTAVSNRDGKQACMAILVWASHPHFESKELSRKVAFDILEFVKLDCSFKRYIDYHKYTADQSFEELSYKMPAIYKNVFDSSQYKKMNNLFIDKALYYASEPYYSIKSQYKKYIEDIELFRRNHFGYDNSFNVMSNYLFRQEQTLIDRVFIYSGNMDYPQNERRNIETYLGYMEFAAVALLINSYYCYNQKLPKSIGELEEWCGKKLPTNREDNTPFEIDSVGEHTLTFKEIGKYYYSKGKQLYFNFSK